MDLLAYKKKHKLTWRKLLAKVNSVGPLTVPLSTLVMAALGHREYAPKLARQVVRACRGVQLKDLYPPLERSKK